MASGTHSGPLKAVIVGVPAFGVVLAAAAAVTGGLAAPYRWRWAIVPACVGSVLLAGKFPVKIGLEQKVNLGALPCIVAALLLPPAIGPATACLSVLASNRLVHRTWPESAFNAGNVLIASALAALIGVIRDDVDDAQVVRATAAGLLYVAVNTGLAVLPAALHSQRRYFPLLKKAAAATWPASLTLAACAVSMAVLSVKAPLATPLPLLVLPLIYRVNLAIETQAKAIETQTKANEQLARVLSAQRRFLTDVSHQVATPLATIMTNLAILSRLTRADSAQEAVANSVTAAERMKSMLGRLRALAHADEDVPLRRELVDLAELTADVVHAYAAQAGTLGIGLVTEVKSRDRVNVDKDLLREAVANLVDNAIRVTPPGAQVTLRVGGGSTGPSIEVIDTGPGIEDERLAHLFDRFQRSQTGSGLGLAITRRVIERHGGTIHVLTEPGVGSTFTIQLPGS